MRTRTIVVSGAAAVTAALLGIGVALPAAADTTGTTSATVTVTRGSLSITVQASAGNLGFQGHSVGGGTMSGPLGEVQVIDDRSAVAGSGWVASALSTAFAPTTGPAIPASAVSYKAGVITKVGTATYTANDPGDLTDLSPVVTATGITGDNTATWHPTITVADTGGMAAGVYSATITHSVV
jgi:hypothetical protein